MELETANAGAEAPASESLSPAPSTPAPETNASPEPTVTTDVTLDDDLRAVYQKSTATRDRDDSGRFVSKEPGEAETPAETVTDQNPEAERIEQAKPAIEPPVSWSRETRELWAKLPPEAQEIVAKRESEAHAQISRLGQTAKAAEPLLQVVEQNRELFAKRNLSPDQGISALLNAQRRLDENPVAAIGWLASQYGVDLSAFANPDGTASAQNPVVMSLQHEIAALKRELAETSSTVKQTQAERQATELAKYQGAVNAFLEGKNLTEADEAELVVLVNAEKQLNPEKTPDQLLKDAYETFLYRSPERREKTIREKLAAEQAKQAGEAKKKAAEAKKLAGLNVRSHPASSSSATTMDETLRDAYRRAQSR